MSGVNITCNIGNQLGNGGGEMKFNVASKDLPSLATCIATEIVNEILENALDIATMGSVAGLECDTIAFSVDNSMCRFSSSDIYEENLNKFNNLQSNSLSSFTDEIDDGCPGIKEIIDGLSSIHVPNQNAEEPLRLDVEMKRLLSEMMSPPYDIVNYETLPRKDGVGDQPVEEAAATEPDASKSDECLVDIEKTKIVEKKTRVTDLVMNSKQVLSEYLMSEESRKQQDEWEESNEQVLQVIELDYVTPDEALCLVQSETMPENVALPDDDEDLFTPIPQDDCMDNIDLSLAAFKAEERQISPEKPAGRGGDNNAEKQQENKENLAGSSHSKNIDDVRDSNANDVMKEEKGKNKFQILKKKKWNINFKFWGLGKKKRGQEKTHL